MATFYLLSSFAVVFLFSLGGSHAYPASAKLEDTLLEAISGNDIVKPAFSNCGPKETEMNITFVGTERHTSRRFHDGIRLIYSVDFTWSHDLTEGSAESSLYRNGDLYFQMKNFDFCQQLEDSTNQELSCPFKKGDRIQTELKFELYHYWGSGYYHGNTTLKNEHGEMVACTEMDFNNV